VTVTLLYAATGVALMLVGLAAVLLRRNLLKIVLGFSLLGTGTHLLIVSLGHIPGGTAPILESAPALLVAPKMVDPVVQALVLTAIVIGVGVTGLMLAYVIRLYARTGSLDVERVKGDE